MDILNEVAHGGGIELRTCLVLAANAQSQSLEESVRAYMPLSADRLHPDQAGRGAAASAARCRC